MHVRVQDRVPEIVTGVDLDPDKGPEKGDVLLKVEDLVHDLDLVIKGLSVMWSVNAGAKQDQDLKVNQVLDQDLSPGLDQGADLRKDKL